MLTITTTVHPSLFVCLSICPLSHACTINGTSQKSSILAIYSFRVAQAIGCTIPRIFPHLIPTLIVPILTPSRHVVLISVLFKAPTIKSSRSTWAVRPPLCCFRPHPPSPFIMTALWNRTGHYIFALWFLLSSFFFLFSSPNLSGRRLDVYHTSTHGVTLVRI